MALNKENAGWWGFPLAILVLVSISTAISLFMVNMGLPIFPQDKKVEEAPKPAAEIVSQWAVSPAMSKLTQSMEEPPAGWQGTGTIMTSPQTPYPFSCVTDGINPVVAVAKNFEASGSSIQVVATTYSAGLGAQGMKGKFDKANICAGGDAYYSLSTLQGLGAEAYQANVSKTGLNTRTVIWRYGDIVVYLIADRNNNNAAMLANVFQENMMAKLAGACVAEDYAEDAPARNPFSGLKYSGYFADKKVTIPKMATPKVPTTATYKATSLPGPAVDVQDVERPIQPTEYPVWPLLPAEMTKPAAPKSPASEIPSEKNVKIMAEDKTGPGCGWAFTGSTAPLFDSKIADGYNAEQETKGVSELTSAAKKWQSDVLAYWEAYDKFKQDIPAWDAYVKQVNDVKDAWHKIDTAWANYKEAKAVYDDQVRARDDFLSRQKAAKAAYDKNVEQCKAQDAADTKKAEEDRKKAEEDKNKPSPSASPTASPSATPTETPAPRVDCPAQRPEILDQSAPTVDEAPKAPADPRPANARG